MSRESFDQKVIEFRTITLVIMTRMSNHNICQIPYNLTIQQSEGKTAQVSRVANKEVNIEVSELVIGSS
jgi:hypothetical protein